MDHPLPGRWFGPALTLSLAAGCGTASSSESSRLPQQSGAPPEQESGPASSEAIEAGGDTRTTDATSSEADAPRDAGSPTTSGDAPEAVSDASSDGNASSSWDRMYGVTVDDISNVSAIVSALGALP